MAKKLDRLKRSDTLALLRRICQLSDAVDGTLESAEGALVEIRRIASDCLDDMGDPIPNPADQD
jgi:hypothetical protein